MRTCTRATPARAPVAPTWRARAVVVAAFAASALALAVGPAAAQSPTARAYLTPGSPIGVGTPFVLNVEVSGAQQLAAEPQVPDLSAFARYTGSNSQSSMRVVNGRRSVSVTVQYRFQALVEGTYTIPAIDVEAGGETLSTEPISLTVSGDAAAGGGEDRQGVGSDDLFITAEATKTSVVEGEPLVVEYRIWTRVDVTSFNFTSVPEPEGFWVEDVTPAGQPRVEQLTRGGQTYASAVIRRIALVPTGAGTKRVEPIVMEAQVRVQSEDPFDRFFGGRSLFGGQSVSVGVVSDAVEVEVAPLPPGAPRSFTGVVGSLDVETSLDRDSVDANEAVTLTVRVSGDGNIRAVQPPDLDLPEDFEAFPPEVSESVRPLGPGLTGEKTFEYVLIPRAPGQREIPPVEVAYLDADAGAYRTVTAPALPLRVGGTPVTGPAALVRGGVAELRQDIRFIHLGARLQPVRGPLHEGLAFWVVAILPLAAIGGALALRRQRDRLEGDVAYARGRRAGRVARKRLARARELAAGEDARPFYAEVARALRGLVADKLDLAEAGLRTAEVAGILEGRGVGADVAERVAECLERCDRQRFAPPTRDADERARFLEQAGELMTALDRELRG